MHEHIERALNDQINNELYSSYMYLAIANYFDEMALTGFAHWMRMQWQEETLHADKLITYIGDQDGALKLRDIKAPKQDFASPLEAAQTALQSEKDNTEQINDLYELAVKVGDHATEVMMQWFITEQVEEEKSARTIVDRLRLAGDDKGALLMLDSQMSQRASSMAEGNGQQ